jgi:hypothetical protein
LEVHAGILVEKLSADDEPGLIIQNHDAVGPSGNAIFLYIGTIKGISLVHAGREFLFKSPPVPNAGSREALEIVFADEALKGGDGRIGCIDEAIGNHDRANAGGTEPGKPFTKLIDFGNGIRIQSAAVSLVRTFLGYKCVKAAFAVGGFPA